MKLPLRRIALIVLASLAVLTCYQAYWLVGLYRTLQRETEANIHEAMRMSDYAEMMVRIEWLRQNSEEHGFVDVSAGFSSKGRRVIRSMAVVSPNDSLQVNVKITDKDSVTAAYASTNSALSMNSGMAVILESHRDLSELTNYVQQGLHSGLDYLKEPNIQLYDSLLTDYLHNRGIDCPHKLLHLHHSPDSTFTDTLAVVATEGYAPTEEAVGYDYAFDLHRNESYRLLLEPIGSIVLSQMLGILVSSYLLLLVLCFAFGFLIHTLLRQRSLEEMKTDFTNNITHELKTPIAVAFAANDALLNFGKASEKEQREKYLRICQEQLRRLSGLVEQILSMSMERRKGFRLRLETFALREVLPPLVEQHKLKADKPVSIALDIVPEDLTVTADRTHFTNIVSNLIDNAIKYSREEAEITIRCQKVEGKTELSVSDHGIGIAAEKQKHVFDKFYRVPTGNLHDVKGYGLGLYYVKSLVEKHGGTVSVESALGKGSTFTIKI